MCETNFEIGDLVRWFKYSHDMIIIEGGTGCIVSFRNYDLGEICGVLIEVLCSSGDIEAFEPFALEKVVPHNL